VENGLAGSQVQLCFARARPSRSFACGTRTCTSPLALVDPAGRGPCSNRQVIGVRATLPLSTVAATLYLA
jgi:hypothetical protein